MSDIWTFKGERLRTGDYVSFKTYEVPLPQVEASVISVDGDRLEVVSTHLAPFRHGGFFHEAVIRDLRVLLRAKHAIPRESGRNFIPYQRVSATCKGVLTEGKLIAAFEGKVIARRADGKVFAGDARDFTPIASSHANCR